MKTADQYIGVHDTHSRYNLMLRALPYTVYIQYLNVTRFVLHLS